MPGPDEEPEKRLIPPEDFVIRFNAANPGRFRTALDPLVMAAWESAAGGPPLPPCIVTGT